jgi:hypothetical protein
MFVVYEPWRASKNRRGTLTLESWAQSCPGRGTERPVYTHAPIARGACPIHFF